MGVGRPRRHHHHASFDQRMEEGEEEGIELYHGVKLGEFWNTNIQVAINEGNRRGDAFFVVRIGKAGTSMPFQQPIPLDFARYHPKLHLKEVTLEVSCGNSWIVVVRAHNQAVRFGKGWRQFSLENSLRKGYQLLFTLVGKTYFVVKFFDNLGKRCSSFPPLVGAESHSSPTDDEHASELPPLETSVARLLEVPSAKPATPQARPAALNSDQAKVILRQFLPQVHPDRSPSPEVPNSKTTVPNEVEESEHVGSQGTHEEQAKEEGKKNYIDLDSDDDDRLVHPQASFTSAKQDLPKGVTGTPKIRDIYGAMRNKDDELHTREETGFHSPEKVSTPRPAKNVHHLVSEEREDSVQQHHGEINQDNDEVDRFTTLKTSSDDIPLKPLARERPVRKKVCAKRTSWEGKGKDTVPSSAASARSPSFDDHRDVLGEKAATRSGTYRKEVRDTSWRRAVQQGNASEEDSMETLSPAMRLQQQQGCTKYSEVVSKCKRRHVSDEERNGTVNAAKRFASALENEKFLVVMHDNQVYHDFHLTMPRGILEMTGAQRGHKVKVCLVDRQKAFYVVNWVWHSFCETPLLNSNGWAKFALDHMLEEGDVCVFELVDSSPAFISGLLFCVHIFRVVETSVQDSSIHELSGGQTPLSKTLEKKSSAAISPDRELRLERDKKRPITDLGRPSLQRKFRKPYNLQSWTKFIKPRVQGHFGGSRAQRRF